MSENSTPSSASSGDLVQYNAPDFGVIPAELMCDQRMSRNARLLGCLLWSYRNKDTGEAFPKQKTLADRIGVSVRSVGKWMAELRKHGWMQSQHRISVDSTYHGNPGALIHTLYWSPNKGKPEPPFRSNRNRRSGTTGTPTTQEHPNRTDQKNTSISSTPISKTETALLDAGVYPRTVTRLIREYPEDRILQKVRHFAQGELVRAIEENWSLPKQKHSRGEQDYRAGQFANFWDAPTPDDERSGPQKIGDVLP